MTLAISNAP